MVALSVRCEGEELTDTHELTNRKVKTRGVKPQPGLGANKSIPGTGTTSTGTTRYLILVYFI